MVCRQAGFFSDPPIARNSRFVLTSHTPRFRLCCPEIRQKLHLFCRLCLGRPLRIEIILVVTYVVVKPSTSFLISIYCLTQSPVVLPSSQPCVAPNIVTEGSTWRSSTENSHFLARMVLNLNVSLSPIGLCQKTIFISSGQVLRGKNASPFRIFKSSALFCDTSFLERDLIVLRYSRSADITQY